MRLLGLGGPPPAMARVVFAVVAAHAEARLDAGFGGDPKALPGPVYDAWQRLAGTARRWRLAGGSDPGRQRLLALDLGDANWHGPHLTPAEQAMMEHPAASFGVFADGSAGDLSVLASARELMWRVADRTDGLVLDHATMSVRRRPGAG